MGERIHYARVTLRGLTQAQLAAELDVDAGYVSKMERGARAPSDLLITRIAQILGCSRDWLMTGRGDPHRNNDDSAVVEPRVQISVDMRDAVIEMACHRRDDPAVMRALLRAKPPQGRETDLSFWLEVYEDARDAVIRASADGSSSPNTRKNSSR